MEENNYTREGLRKISPGIVDVFFRDLVKRGKEKTLFPFLSELENTVSQENKSFEDFIKGYASAMISAGCLNKDIGYMKTGAYLAYEIFRRQAESDSLDK